MVVFNSCNRQCTNITKIKPPRKNLLTNMKDRVHTHVPSSTSGNSGCRRQEQFRQSSGMPGSGFHHSTLHYYTCTCVHTAALLLCFSLLYMSPLFLVSFLGNPHSVLHYFICVQAACLLLALCLYTCHLFLYFSYVYWCTSVASNNSASFAVC